MQLYLRSLYPAQLQSAWVGGRVGVALWIEPSGAVAAARLTRGSGWDELDDAALRAAYLLQFEPATQGGRPVGVWVSLDLVFTPAADRRLLPQE